MINPSLPFNKVFREKFKNYFVLCRFCGRYCFFVWEKIIELAKEKKKIPAKDKWELPDVIQIISIVVLHMSKIMVHIYTT